MIEHIKAALSNLTKAVESIDNRDDKSIVMKKVDSDQRKILGVVLEPDAFDLHNDIYSAEEVRKACENYNANCLRGNVEHLINTDKLVVTKSFVLEVDATIGDQPVKAGSWLMEMKVNDDTLWDMVKSGDFTGFSIGGKAAIEDIE